MASPCTSQQQALLTSREVRVLLALLDVTGDEEYQIARPDLERFVRSCRVAVKSEGDRRVRATNAPGQWLTPKQVGELIGRHPTTVIGYMNQGKFPNAKNQGGSGNGRRYGIPRSDVDNYLEAGRILGQHSRRRSSDPRG